MKRYLTVLVMAFMLVISLTCSAEAASGNVKLSSKSVTVYVGSSKKVSVVNANKKTKVTYKSNNKNVSVSSKGTIKGKKVGNSVITVKVGKVKLTCKVTVKNPGLNKKSIFLEKGKKYTLSVKGTKAVKWSTANKKVAVVSSKGKVTAKGRGSTKVSVKCKNGKTYSCRVTVGIIHEHKYKEVKRVKSTCTKEGYILKKCSCGVELKTYLKLAPHKYKAETKNSTCVVKGYTQKVCSVCKKKTGYKELPRLPHNLSVIGEQPATCKKEGYKVSKCTRCSYEEHMTYTSKSHTWEQSSIEQPTCQKEGRVGYLCKVCKKEMSRVIPISDHYYGVQEVKSSCTVKGRRKVVCTVCGDVKEDVILPFADHIPGEPSVIKDNTCGTAGIEVIRCKTCNKEISRKVLESTGSHTPGEPVIESSTCTKKGTKVISCEVCGVEISREELPLSVHRYISRNVPSTCTVRGFRDSMCTVCGNIKDHVDLGLLPHTEVSEVKEQATCANEGTEVVKCSVCKRTLRETSIPKAAHKEGNVEKVQATCQKEGYERCKCSVCGKLLWQKTLPKVDHVFKTVTVVSTCTAKGYTEEKCKSCSLTRNRKELPIVGHNSTIIDRKESTCKEAGYTKYGCSMCGRVSSTVTIKKKPHTEGVTEVSATCVKDGYRLTLCSVCGEEINRVSIPKLGHNLRYTTVVESTCTKEGTKKVTCSRCSYEGTETIAKKEHVAINVIFPSTCSVAGRVESRCDVCYKYLGQEALPLEPHSFIRKVIKTATCLEKGRAVYECTVCHSRDGRVEEIPTIQHNSDSVEIVQDSTYSSEGLGIVKCTMCGTEVGREVIPKKSTVSAINAISTGKQVTHSSTNDTVWYRIGTGGSHLTFTSSVGGVERRVLVVKSGNTFVIKVERYRGVWVKELDFSYSNKTDKNLGVYNDGESGYVYFTPKALKAIINTKSSTNFGSFTSTSDVFELL